LGREKGSNFRNNFSNKKNRQINLRYRLDKLASRRRSM